MRKFKRFLIQKMDECKEQGLGGSVWVEKKIHDDSTSMVLFIGKHPVAGTKIEPCRVQVTVPEMNFREDSYLKTLSLDAKEIISEIESYDFQ